MIRYTSNAKVAAPTNSDGNNNQPPAAPPPPATPPSGPRKPRRLLGIREVMHMTSLSRANIYRRLKDDPDFPRPVEISTNRIGWHEHEVDDWIANLPRTTPSPTPSTPPLKKPKP